MAHVATDAWAYEKKRRHDKRGKRWHFATHHVFEPALPYSEQPMEIYFRNDDRTEFGLLRFERKRDNPFRNWETMVTKIMNDAGFRQKLLDPSTKSVWRKHWR